MKKYLSIFKTTFNNSIQYISSLISKFIGFIIIILVLLNLWTFIYQDSSNTINGYNLNQMIWYIILAELITFSSNSKISTEEIKNTIKSGNIAYQINKPYNYISYIFTKYLAETSIRTFVFTSISITFGLIFTGPLDTNLKTIILAIPIFIIAIIITGLIHILISLTSFWFEDSKPFQMVIDKFILIFGILFPIEMFPKIIGSILKYTPIYSIAYGPAKLVISFNINLYKSIIISQIITLIIIIILINIIYKKGVKKLNVNGG